VTPPDELRHPVADGPQAPLAVKPSKSINLMELLYKRHAGTTRERVSDEVRALSLAAAASRASGGFAVERAATFGFRAVVLRDELTHRRWKIAVD
jgi:hypothetical protein